MSESVELNWKVHTPNLLGEVLQNPGTSMLKLPLNIFARNLMLVAERAVKINDPILNELMCRLALYEEADPENENYNPERLREVSLLALKCRGEES